MGKCYICRGEAEINLRHMNNPNLLHIKCARCGVYDIAEIAATQLQTALGGEGSQQRANASGYIWENQGLFIGSNDEVWLAKLPTPSFQSRIEKLMVCIERASDSFADNVVVHVDHWLGRTWCKGRSEILYMLTSLKETNRLSGRGGSGLEQTVQITPQGLAFLEDIRRRTPRSQQVFVAMWFHPCMTSVYEKHVAPAIRSAGYDPKRIDKKEHFGKIDDEIIGEIRRSRFIVADFTGHRGGVYYEAGFAHGLGIPVIFSCRKKELHRLHFDVRQYVTIDWETPEDLGSRLKNRVVGAIGWGPLSAEVDRKGT